MLPSLDSLEQLKRDPSILYLKVYILNNNFIYVSNKNSFKTQILPNIISRNKKSDTIKHSDEQRESESFYVAYSKSSLI